MNGLDTLTPENSSWHSYPKVWNLGHFMVTDILNDEVHFEEKVDGSQFSFGTFNGQIKVRSKGTEINLDDVPKMFEQAIATVRELQPILINGWTYRGEYLSKPKHNVWAYERTPNKNIILFDICPRQEVYLDYEDKAIEAERIGLEVVPCFFKGKVHSLEEFTELLDRTSVLGGQKIEGVVIKNYKRFGRDGKALLAKVVSEDFREVHKGTWKAEHNPGQGDIIALLGGALRSEARWRKAVQRLAESGTLENSPRDIGNLIKSVRQDIMEECESHIKEKLFKWAEHKIGALTVQGLPEWYKAELIKKQFEGIENGAAGSGEISQ